MATANEKAEFGRLFFELFKLFKQYMRKNFEEEGMTLPQGAVIGTLAKDGEMKITDLSCRLNMTNSTISGILDRLEKQQLVVRKRSEEDRRIVYVRLTPKVEEMYKERHEKIEDKFQELLNSGTPEEIDKIIDGLNVLKKILNNCINKEC